MELEQRVKTLEYEIKILKNEIQRTLLDIQEQILIHYYPSLRTEESGPSEGIKSSFASIQEKRGPTGETPALLDERAMDGYFRDKGNRGPTGETPALPKVVSVSLDKVRAAQMDTTVSPNDGSHPGAEAGQASALELSEWIGDSVQKIGGDRTSRLVEICARRGWLAPESGGVLLRLASLSDGENVPQKVAINEVLGALLKLNEVLGRGTDIEEALTLIEEADLG